MKWKIDVVLGVLATIVVITIVIFSSTPEKCSCQVGEFEDKMMERKSFEYNGFQFKYVKGRKYEYRQKND